MIGLSCIAKNNITYTEKDIKVYPFTNELEFSHIPFDFDLVKYRYTDCVDSVSLIGNKNRWKIRALSNMNRSRFGNRVSMKTELFICKRDIPLSACEVDTSRIVEPEFVARKKRVKKYLKYKGVM